MIRHIINKSLSHPLAFDTVRSIIAGDQRHTKRFVADALYQIHAKTILDVGCGTGDFASTIPKNSSYEGIDMSADFIHYAQKKYRNNPHIMFSVQDATDQSFYKRKRYDAILFVSMFHHLSDRQLTMILPLLHLCKPKIIVIADIIPEPNGFLRKLMVRLDAGKYIRSPKEKLRILSQYLKVDHTEIIPSRLAIQMGILCHYEKKT